MENPDLKSLPDQPVPEGAAVAMIRTSDGVTLRSAWFPPSTNLLPGARARGTVCVFPGRTEFIEKYYEVIEDLRKRGFAVAMLDWRGQGLSARNPKKPFHGHVRNFDHYQRDLGAFLDQVVLPSCPKPYYALAHSMGGHILFVASAGGSARHFERMVLTAPMLHLAPLMLAGWHRLRYSRGMIASRIISQRLTRWATLIGRLIGRGGSFAPGSGKATVHEFANNLLSSDAVRFQRFNAFLAAYPELGLGGPTNAWVHSACVSMRRSLRPDKLQKLAVPTLIIASGADEIVSTPAIEKLTPDLRLLHHIVIRNARHEVMFERDELRNQFWAAFDAFIPGSEHPGSRSASEPA
ncbi:MAG: alpha/beta hydrolase [Rhizobiales bacterium]|nr:alpha/beta hydrolase [Hyphomicrobiales bacterium]